MSWSFVMGVEPVVGPKFRLLSVHSLRQTLAVFVAYMINLVECSALLNKQDCTFFNT